MGTAPEGGWSGLFTDANQGNEGGQEGTEETERELKEQRVLLGDAFCFAVHPYTRKPAGTSVRSLHSIIIFSNSSPVNSLGAAS
jgi:hypothetical protein